MTTAVVAIFVLVYLGMILGGLPFLQLDRTGVALLGAIAVVGLGALDTEHAAAAVHLPTVLLLFAFMVVSAQLRLGGFYGWVTRRIASLPVSPPTLLAALIAVVAALSAIFSNDVVCLAAAPVLADACMKRRLNPIPYLIALACAANVGSAATLIGNPQNMLIGAKLQLDFGRYIILALPVVLPSLALTWAVIAWCSRGRWHAPARSGTSMQERRDDDEPLDIWQTLKGLSVAAVLLVVFLATALPREVAALAGAAILLTSRKLHSRKMLGLVDWELLVLFIGQALHPWYVGLSLALLALLPLSRTAARWVVFVTIGYLLAYALTNLYVLPVLPSLAGGLVAGGTIFLVWSRVTDH